MLKRNSQEKYELPVSENYKFQKKGQTKNSWSTLLTLQLYISHISGKNVNEKT